MAAPGLVLSKEQECALEAMLSGRDVECMGLAGTGKTTLLRICVDQLRLACAGKAGSVVVCAPTWEAAANLEIDGALSFHKAFGLVPRDTSVAEILKQKDPKRPNAEVRWRLLAVQYLVIDEVSMQDEATFWLGIDLMEKLRASDGVRRPRVKVIAFGDLCQLQVVDADHRLRGGPRKRSFVLGERWAERKPVRILLETPMRQASDPEFLKAMVDLAYGGPSHDGVLSLETTRLLQSRLVKQVPAADEERVTFVYAHHSDVNRHNDARLDRLDAKTERLYVSTDFTSRYVTVAELDKKCRLVRRLRVRVGAVVRLTATLSPDLYNGRRGTVLEADDNKVWVCFGNKPTDSRVAVERVTIEDRDRSYVKWSRRQIPLALSWARTAHSVQGMTGAVAACITRAFEAEHPYVVFTRARTRADLFVVGALPPSRPVSRDTLDHYDTLRAERHTWMKDEAKPDEHEDDEDDIRSGAKRVRVERDH